MANIYEIKNVYQRYNGQENYANQNINLMIKKNEITAFYGENGSGKSTLIEALVGYRAVAAGEIFFEGQNINQLKKDIQRKISYSTQSPLPLDFMRVQSILIITAQLRGVSSAEAFEQANYWLERLKIEDLKEKKLSSLSGGQRRLVGFVTALVGDYEVLILDEPTNEMDPEKRLLVWKALVEQNRTRKTTVIVVTHDVNESEKYVDNAVLFSNGQILVEGSPRVLKEKAEDNYRVTIKIFPEKKARIKELLLNAGLKCEMIGLNHISFSIKKRHLKQIQDTLLNETGVEEYTFSAPSLMEAFDLYREENTDAASVSPTI